MNRHGGWVTYNTMNTPPSSPKVLVCPPAPVRRRLDVLYSGIQPDDFIKPDPAMTQKETRHYVLAELKLWLSGARLATQTMALLETNGDDDSPASRLVSMVAALDRVKFWKELSMEQKVRVAGQLCYDICAASLDTSLIGPKVPDDIRDLALGFIDVEKLPGGAVIRSLWTYSPFKAVREASALSDGADEDEDEGEDADEDEDADKDADEDEDEDEDADADADADKDAEYEALSDNPLFDSITVTIRAPIWVYWSLYSLVFVLFIIYLGGVPSNKPPGRYN